MPATASEIAVDKDVEQQEQQVQPSRKRRASTRTALADVNGTAVANQQQQAQVQHDEPAESEPSGSKRPRRVQQQKAATAAEQPPPRPRQAKADSSAAALKPEAKQAAAKQAPASKPAAGTAAKQAAGQQPKNGKSAAAGKAAAAGKTAAARRAAAPQAAAAAAGGSSLWAAAAGPTGTGNPAAAVGPDASIAEAAARKHPKPTSLQHSHLHRADPRVESAAAAAGLTRLKSRPGRFCIAEGGGVTQVLHVPDVAGFRLGDQTGHHAHLFVYKPGSSDPAEVDAAEAKAFKGDPADDERWAKVTLSCHDCQHQHVIHLCGDERHGVHNKGAKWSSICNSCLIRRQEGTKLTLAELHQSCPMCRGCCTCKACMGKADYTGQVAVVASGADEQAVQGAYLMRTLAHPLSTWLDKARVEAAAGGFTDLSLVPVAPLGHKDKCFCDRCATNLIGLAGACSQCGSEVCVDCLRELRQQQQQQPSSSSAGGPFTWTCWKPVCEEKQEQSPPKRKQARKKKPAKKQGKKQQQRGKQQQQPEEEQQQQAEEQQQQQEQQQHQEQPAAEGEQQQQEQQQPATPGGGCWCVPGAAPLALRWVWPGDLVPDLVPAAVPNEGVAQPAALRQLMKRLNRVAQAASKVEAVQDCPFLPRWAAQGLVLTGASGSPLTLAQLEAPDWWTHLPEGLRDVWRRHAGREGRDSFLFTPHFKDMQLSQTPPDKRQAQGAAFKAEVQRVCLALVLFWARWRQGEPVIVRGCEGRIPWDPHTMVRAVKCVSQNQEQQAQTDARVVVLDCANYHTLHAKECNSKRFFDGYTHGFFRLADGSSRPGPLGEVVILPLDLADADEDTVAAAAAAAGGDRGCAVVFGPMMLKVKDWPPTDDFLKEMPRHMVDFVERLVVRCMTHPCLGWSSLNLASMLLKSDNPTDLGPKCYLAYGRQQEAVGEGDSVTKCHMDMTDAVNILTQQEPGGDAVARRQQQQQQGGSGAAAAAGGSAAARCGEAVADKPSYGGAGAVWDIWPRGKDTLALSKWMAANSGDFCHLGKPVDTVYGEADAAALMPVMSHQFMLQGRHREQLFQETGVAAWHFEQYLNEGVFIPAGCPHQVRNLASCSKVAVDFVSPEAVGSILEQQQHLRTQDLAHGDVKVEVLARDHEKLQSCLLLLRGALTAEGMAAAKQVLMEPRQFIVSKVKGGKGNDSDDNDEEAAASAD